MSIQRPEQSEGDGLGWLLWLAWFYARANLRLSLSTKRYKGRSKAQFM